MNFLTRAISTKYVESEARVISPVLIKGSKAWVISLVLIEGSEARLISLVLIEGIAEVKRLYNAAKRRDVVS